MEDRQHTTKSILDNYSGNVLDFPNGKEKIVERSRKFTLLKNFRISHKIIKLS